MQYNQTRRIAKVNPSKAWALVDDSDSIVLLQNTDGWGYAVFPTKKQAEAFIGDNAWVAVLIKITLWPNQIEK